MTYILSNKI